MLLYLRHNILTIFLLIIFFKYISVSCPSVHVLHILPRWCSQHSGTTKPSSVASFTILTKHCMVYFYWTFTTYNTMFHIVSNYLFILHNHLVSLIRILVKFLFQLPYIHLLFHLIIVEFFLLYSFHVMVYKLYRWLLGCPFI